MNYRILKQLVMHAGDITPLLIVVGIVWSLTGEGTIGGLDLGIAAVVLAAAGWAAVDRDEEAPRKTMVTIDRDETARMTWTRVMPPTVILTGLILSVHGTGYDLMIIVSWILLEPIIKYMIVQAASMEMGMQGHTASVSMMTLGWSVRMTRYGKTIVLHCCMATATGSRNTELVQIRPGHWVERDEARQAA